MVINGITYIGPKRPSLVPTARPRPQAVNVSSMNIRHHEALMEARRHAKMARSDLQSAANALSAANAENDRLVRRIKELEAGNSQDIGLAKRVKELEAENEGLRKELAECKRECQNLAEKLAATQATGMPAKQGRRRRNKAATPETAAEAAPETNGLGPQ